MSDWGDDLKKATSAAQRARERWAARSAPSSAEGNVIGCLLLGLQTGAARTIFECMHPSLFREPKHAATMAAMLLVDALDRPFDVVQVGTVLKQAGAGVDIGWLCATMNASKPERLVADAESLADAAGIPR